MFNSKAYIGKCLILLFVVANFEVFGQRQSGLFFIENKGQWSKETRYVAQIPGGQLFVENNQLRYEMKQSTVGKSDPETPTHHIHESRSQEVMELNVLFLGANLNPKFSTRLEKKERYNYYLGADKSKWAENCRAFEVIMYEDVYDGVDLKLYAKGNSLKYDLVLDPGSQPSQIQFQYRGGNEMFLEGGCSFIQVGDHTIMENRPVAFQVDDEGNRKEVTCKYKLHQKTLSFEMGVDYQSGKTLVIDPELIFSTFSGSTSDNFGYTACFDNAGNLYSGGIVFGSNFPSTTGTVFQGGTSDMAILKYDSSGQNLLYSTYIGGSSGDTPHSLIVNSKNELLVMGTTGSTDYPTTSGAYDNSYNGGRPFSIFGDFAQGTDLVVTKLNASGNLLSSTLIGGPGNDGVLKMSSLTNYENDLIYNYGDFQRGDIIIDNEDNIYVASSTDSVGFPITSTIQSNYGGGNSDAVIFSLTSDLSSLRWSSYLGGNNDDAAYSIKLNELGHVLVGGGTTSSNFPATVNTINPTPAGAVDGFISILDIENDQLTHSTFMGTTAYDQVYFIDIDGDQNIYATGQTLGTYPVTSGAYNNPNSAQFIHKLNKDLSQTLFSTVYGSGQRTINISPTAFLANECENIFLSGWGGATNIENGASGAFIGTTSGLPVSEDAIFPRTDGSDFYLLVLSADGSRLLYATFFGGTNNGGDHVDGGTSRFDKRGIVYQSVCSCGGDTDNFPTTEGAWSTINRGTDTFGRRRCNNAAFKFDLASLDARFITSDSLKQEIGLTSGCKPLTLLFTNTSVGGEEFLWSFGDGSSSSDSTSKLHTYEESGIYTASLNVRDENTCTVEDIFSVKITVFDDQVFVSESHEICDGANITLDATGGTSYQWSPTAGLSSSTIGNPMASPSTSTTYNVEITTPNGCIRNRTVDITVLPAVVEDFEYLPLYDNCDGELIYTVKNQTTFDGDVLWDFGDGTTSTDPNPSHVYSEPGEYTLNLETNSSCVEEKSISIDYQEVSIPNVFTPNEDGKNDFFVITSPFEVKLSVFNRAGHILFDSPGYANNWDGGNLKSGTYYYSARFHGTSEVCSGWVQLLR